MNDLPMIPLATFWQWLQRHPDCILRAGCHDAVIYDDDDLHWELASEEAGTLVLQLVRGKRLTGEVLVAPERVSWVQGVPGQDDGEFIFDLVHDGPGGPVVEWFVVLSHGYDGDAGGDADGPAPVH